MDNFGETTRKPLETGTPEEAQRKSKGNPKKTKGNQKHIRENKQNTVFKGFRLTLGYGFGFYVFWVFPKVFTKHKKPLRKPTIQKKTNTNQQNLTQFMHLHYLWSQISFRK